MPVSLLINFDLNKNKQLHELYARDFGVLTDVKILRKGEESWMNENCTISCTMMEFYLYFRNDSY